MFTFLLWLQSTLLFGNFLNNLEKNNVIYSWFYLCLIIVQLAILHVRYLLYNTLLNHKQYTLDSNRSPGFLIIFQHFSPQEVLIKVASQDADSRQYNYWISENCSGDNNVVRFLHYPWGHFGRIWGPDTFLYLFFSDPALDCFLILARELKSLQSCF